MIGSYVIACFRHAQKCMFFILSVSWMVGVRDTRSKNKISLCHMLGMYDMVLITLATVVVACNSNTGKKVTGSNCIFRRLILVGSKFSIDQTSSLWKWYPPALMVWWCYCRWSYCLDKKVVFTLSIGKSQIFGVKCPWGRSQRNHNPGRRSWWVSHTQAPAHVDGTTRSA